jgi:hypothetical protein
VTDGKIIAFGLLTQRDLKTLGPSFSRAWPVDEAPCFTQLLDAIDVAESQSLRREGEVDGYGRAPATPHPIGGGRR